MKNEFKINNHIIKVIYDDVLTNKFGYWDPVTLTIHLAKKVVNDNEELVSLTEVQITNTFCHELMHVFQHMAGIEYDESQAQVFGNFLYDYLNE